MDIGFVTLDIAMIKQLMWGAKVELIGQNPHDQTEDVKETNVEAYKFVSIQ